MKRSYCRALQVSRLVGGGGQVLPLPLLLTLRPMLLLLLLLLGAASGQQHKAAGARLRQLGLETSSYLLEYCELK